ncbi:MAG: serine/threonine protein kinase, partial [Polyangiaceae bacterium]
DVWAMVAILYECLSGSVPFKGNNGPSILLEILTKEPPPPSVAAQGKKYQVPPTLDPVMLKAFKKQASMRTPTMGALADAVGQAYGLTGTHLDWAKRTQDDLEREISARMPELMAAQVAGPADGIADGFFGDSDSLGLMDEAMAQAAPGPMVNLPPQPMGAPYGGYAQGGYDEVPLGVPKNTWLVPAIVGVVALLLGVVLVVVLAS